MSLLKLTDMTAKMEPNAGNCFLGLKSPPLIDLLLLFSCRKLQCNNLRSLPLLSTINALIDITVNHCRQPSTHSSLSLATINALIATAVNHQRTHCRCRQPLRSTINTLIAGAVNHQHTHCHCRQTSTHPLPLPSTINTFTYIVIKFTYII
jgi:hypothetical protein